MLAGSVGLTVDEDAACNSAVDVAGIGSWWPICDESRRLGGDTTKEVPAS
jgi:hypothetical protein